MSSHGGKEHCEYTELTDGSRLPGGDELPAPGVLKGRPDSHLMELVQRAGNSEGGELAAGLLNLGTVDIL